MIESTGARREREHEEKTERKEGGEVEERRRDKTRKRVNTGG